MTRISNPECFVCGHGPHEDRAGHNFWSIEEAERYFSRQPNAHHAPESAYVDEHRPY